LGSDGSEESMNHGTREDKEEDRYCVEEDRYRVEAVEHLVAACCHMARVQDDGIHKLQNSTVNILGNSTNSAISCLIPRASKPSVSMRLVASRSSRTSRSRSQK
jgi:hypothetical protein